MFRVGGRLPGARCATAGHLLYLLMVALWQAKASSSPVLPRCVHLSNCQSSPTTCVPQRRLPIHVGRRSGSI